MSFSLYVHIPYCQRRCPYCDFNAHAIIPWPEDTYTEALLREIHQAAETPTWAGQDVATIFFGGGTPSLFAPASIARILSGVREWFPLSPTPEITLEANPGTITEETLLGFRAAGVNRLSFGVQSFHDSHLRTLGRIHTAAEAEAAIHLARQLGFDAINTDLIYGIPGQSVTHWMADIHRALLLDPGHISTYSLTYESGTTFHEWRSEGRLVPVAEDDEALMFTEARRALREAGYQHYEISNYARPGQACRHNITYWRREPYLGIGAGAHSFASTPGWGRRWATARAPGQYMELIARQGHAITSDEHPSRDQAIAESLFLGLRLLEGVAAETFVRRFALSLEEASPQLGGLVDAGLLEWTDGRIRLTASGLLHADSVFAALL